MQQGSPDDATEDEHKRNSVPTTPQRFRNSTTPPSSARRAIYSDRFIPSRTTTKLEEAFDLFGEEASSRDSGANKNETQMESQILMNNLIRTELLGQSAIDINLEMRLEGTAKSPNRKDSGSSANLFKYRLSQGSSASTIDSHHTSGSEYESPVGGFGPTNNVNRSSIISPKKPTRKIPKNPFKVLDAPSLQDDYYLNLVDWSHHNVLSVALCSSVYLWSACTSKVTKLCDFGSSDMVTSISWALTGSQIAVGMNSGKIQIWDSSACKMVRELHSHESRVGSLAWNSSLLASGSRDRTILLQDIRIRNVQRSSAFSSGHHEISAPLQRSPAQMQLHGSEQISALSGMTASNSDDTFIFADPLTNLSVPLGSAASFSANHALGPSHEPAPTSGSIVRELHAHKQEVCGLKWSFDEKMLASGGNDNKLFVWEPQLTTGRRDEPICRFEDHTAAVKAVAWSPHQQGLLASGGGTADRHIRFWNANTNSVLHKIDTGSQVCNLMWSKTVNEIVSTHGYSLNQVIIWKYPSMQKLATLSGHTLRVLYLAMSPDGSTVVTGAGDETLRFWNVFPGPRNKSGFPSGKSLLAPSSADVR